MDNILVGNIPGYMFVYKFQFKLGCLKKNQKQKPKNKNNKLIKYNKTVIAVIV